MKLLSPDNRTYLIIFTISQFCSDFISFSVTLEIVCDGMFFVSTADIQQAFVCCFYVQCVCDCLH